MCLIRNLGTPSFKINSQSLEDTQAGYISQKYTLARKSLVIVATSFTKVVTSLVMVSTSLVMVSTSLLMVLTSVVKVSTSLVRVLTSLVMVSTSLGMVGTPEALLWGPQRRLLHRRATRDWKSESVTDQRTYLLTNLPTYMGRC